MASLAAAQHFSSFSSQAVNSCHVLLSHAADIICLCLPCISIIFSTPERYLCIFLCHSFYLSSLRYSGGWKQIVCLSLFLFLKTAGCLSPLFLSRKVVSLSCSYASRWSSAIPKTAGVSFSVILQAAAYLVLRYSSENMLFFSVILMTTCCLSLLYSKDRRFSISPLFFSENSMLSFSPLFLRGGLSLSSVIT